MSRNPSIISGILLVLLVTVMSGGGFLLEQTVLRAEGFIDDPAVAALQRAGHGHAGVLFVVDDSEVALMSGGFFLSAAAMAGVDAGTPSLVLRGGAVLLGASLLALAGLLIFRRKIGAAEV